ncbi:heavy metal translocating P-type ATPase [Candidatus Jidaibacter acanthamoebae]|nr:heavy metal translocating P-type ATPase [Candidatus Jidaibacter acanthamoeba]
MIAENVEVKDLVCGMKVVPSNTMFNYNFKGTIYYFCSKLCLEKFQANTSNYIETENHSCCHTHKKDITEVVKGAIYTCPMHPEVKKAGPGICNICGMALEPENLYSAEEDNSELNDMSLRFKVAVILSLPLLILNMGGHFFKSELLHWLINSSHFNWFQLLLATPVVLWSGFPFFQRAWLSIRTCNLNMFTLIGLGIGVAYVYSTLITIVPSIITSWVGSNKAIDVYFEPAAIITALVLLGQILELKARSYTSKVIRQLFELAPETAIIINSDGTEQEVAIAYIHTGDILKVKPGSKIPVDGIIVEGNSTIDQSMVTGEAIPLEKGIGDPIIGGTINGTGSFTMRAEKVGKDTMLAQIVDMVSKAQRSRAPVQRLVDLVAAYFVPVVIIIAMITALSWYIFGPEPEIGYALLTSIAVLIIACPCALGLATPMSIMVGTGVGAREGILIKDAEALETLEKVDTLVVDKTGTLTEGKPRLMNLLPIGNSLDHIELLTFAASLENGSEHPLAESIVKAAQAEGVILKPYSNFSSITGKGVTGLIEKHNIALGNKELMYSLNINTSIADTEVQNYLQQGHTVMYLSIDNQLMGIITVADAIKPTTKAAIQALQQTGVEVIMLTGDNHITASAIAKEIGINTIKANVLPDDKYNFISELQKQGHKVAMAGDGINDAPALIQADVGIAMGTGTDIAIESAGVTLMSGELNGIAKAISLSRITMRNIRQNLFLAFIYNTLLIPVAAGAFYPVFGWLLNPVVAGAAMALSSVSVILNSIRISKIKLSN